MKAKYLGVVSPEDDGPRRVGLAGKSFPRGVFIDVSDIPDLLKAKLSAHPHFEVSDDALSDGDIDAAEAVNGPPIPVGGGEASEGSADNKAALIARLEALQVKHPEVKFDARWGVPKLTAALEAAEFEFAED